MRMTMNDAIMFFEGELKVAERIKGLIKDEEKKRHNDYIDALSYAINAMQIYSDLIPSTRPSQEELLQELNTFFKSNYSLQDVYIFDIELANNDIDDEFDSFCKESLYNIANLCLGKSGIFTCEDNGTIMPRIFKSSVEKDPIRRTEFDKPLLIVKAYAFINRHEKGAEDLIRFLESDVNKDVSISCSVRHKWCSICKADSCHHSKGKFYNGKLCHKLLYGITDIYEWGFVHNRRSQP